MITIFTIMFKIPLIAKLSIKMKKIPHVFISSTYEDLKEERLAVKEGVLRADCFPVGMEYFPSSPKSPWKVIENAISQSDFYILIVAGRYGSIDKETGISYTEREFNYAVEKKIPILIFMSPDIEELSENKIDDREKIKIFRKKLLNPVRHIKQYINVYALEAEVQKALMTAVQELIDTNECSEYERLYAHFNSLVGFLQNQINSLAEASISNSLAFADVSEKIRELKKNNNPTQPMI